MITLIALLGFWCLATWGFVSRKPILIYVFFASLPFGSFAVIPTQISAGLTFTATPIIAILIIVRILASQKGLNFLVLNAWDAKRLGLLFLFWIAAIFATIFMPRLFAGTIEVIPVRGILSQTSLLRPTTQNISQLAYLTISVFATFAFTRALHADSAKYISFRALCGGAILVVTTGLIDYASTYLPTKFILEPFRTASYSLLTDVEVLGGKRVVGLMPEASSYGGLCLVFLATLFFLRDQVRETGIPTLLVTLLLLGLCVCLWLSKSTGAYVGLGVFALFATMNWGTNFIAGRSNPITFKIRIHEFWAVFMLCFGIILFAIVQPSIFDPIVELVDRMVLQKGSSSSFEERGYWRAVSWQAALDSYGFGVGLGGTRASSSIVSIISNTGFLGAILYFSFVLITMFGRIDTQVLSLKKIANGVRWAFLANFVLGYFIGTADFGLFAAFQFGLISSIRNREIR
ncbi:hypothetical protein [Roseibium sp.]|uniref:hypothetical protein n=1 Tax=Roseibium sp. TaxID=1936156 RepID=UPI003B4FFE09